MLRKPCNLLARCLRQPIAVQSMGKKKKNLLKPLEGAEAKYINTQLLKDINEPAYLELLKPPIPFYPLLNIHLKCPDYVTLEEFTRYSQKVFDTIGFHLNDYWALPHRSYKYELMKYEEAVVDSTMVINIYERVIQLRDVKAASVPLLAQLLEASKPPGCTVGILEHSEDQTKERWVVDTTLLAIKKELDEIYTELEELGVTGVRRPELLE